MSTPIISYTSGAAAIAAQQANEAKKKLCEITMPNFNAQQATIAQMQDYSECVQFMHPSEMSSGETIIFKILFVVALFGLAGGIAWDRNENPGCGWFSHIMTGCAGLIIAPLAVSLLAGICLGIGWLFT